MASIKVKKCGSIIIRFRNPVNRKQKTITVPFAGTSVETKQIADIKKAEVEYKITRHKAGLEPFRLDGRNGQTMEALTLGEFHSIVMNDPDRKVNIGSGTMEANLVAIRNLIGVLGKDLPLRQLASEPKWMSQFKTRRFQEGVRRYGEQGLEVDEERIKRGVNVNLKDLSAVFNYSVKAGHIPEHFVPTFEKFKVSKTYPVSLREDELVTILNGLDESGGKNGSTIGKGDYWLAYLIMVETGFRRSSILRSSLNSHNGLKWKHIDWMRNEITTIIKCKEHRLPMTNRLNSALLKRKAELGGAFRPDTFVIRYTGSAFSHKVKKVMKAVGIEKAGSSHIVRHSVPAILLNLGANAWEVKEWMAHSDFKTTDIYVHMRNEELHKLAKRKSRSV